MKKGFTLVEIIISIALIVIVGTTTTLVFLNSNNKNEEIESVTKQVLEAANAYINVEKDENGNTYKNGISRGGKGVQLSLKNLIDKGYIEDNQITTLEKHTNLDSKELYILAAITVLDESQCGENVIEYTASWYEDSEDPIYLCGYKSDVGDGGWTEDDPYLIDTILNLYGEGSLCNGNYSDHGIGFDYDTGIVFITNNHGLCKEDDFYYFSGDTENNYVEINDTLFRIVSFNNEKIRLISENVIEDIDYSSLEFPSQKIYSGSLLEGVLNIWFENFAMEVENNLGVIKNNMFLTGDYCNNKKILSTFNEDTNVGGIFSYEKNCPSEYTIEGLYVGLLSADEAIRGGVKPVIFSDACGSFPDPDNSCNSKHYIGSSWLAQGDPFITMSYAGLILGVSADSDYYGNYSIFETIYTNYIYDYIRPVITISNEVVFSGGGTKSNPYIIEGIR